MKRRKVFVLCSLLMSAVVTWPLVGRTQSPPTLPEIGFLNIGSPHAFAAFVTAFQNGLSAGGYVEGRNVAIEYRWAEGNYDRLREGAVDLVRRRVSLIVATGGLAAARVAKDATDTIPILNIFGVNPVGEGLVASFNRPGGNVTGVSAYASELIPKRLELLRELVPGTAKFALILNPKVPSARFERPDVERAAQEAGQQLSILEASNENELRQAFDSAVAARVGALVVSPDGYFTSQRALIVQLAASHKLPVVYSWREYVAAGGLMSYGPNITDAYRQIGEYASRILKGAKPGELPVQQPTKFYLAVNLKTAKALGIEVPYPLLITASEVVE
jgi:putative ABC transport system substrate-binding protein